VGSHCVDCAKAAEPDVRTKIRYWQARKPAIVTYSLILVNVAVFVILGLAYDFAGMLGGDITEGHVKYGLNDIFLQGEPVRITETYVSQGDEWYRLITSGFLHFGIIHLGLNMLFLFALGNQLEPILGRGKFALLYFAALLGGAAGVLIVDSNSIAAGASGAVFGLMGAYSAGIWQHGVNPLSTSIGSLLLINLFLTFAIPRISIGGHIGGLVAGALCGYIMLAPSFKRYPEWSKWAVPIAVAGLAVAASVLAVSA
jgi:membrane associated rhomboid family serine protease